MTISSAIAKALPAAESARKWHPAVGNTYRQPATQSTAKTVAKALESREDTPMPDSIANAANAGKPHEGTSAALASKDDESSMERRAEEAFRIHMRYGGDYIDENPITGRPGEFHLSSTGRKPALPPHLGKQTGIGMLNGPTLGMGTKVGEERRDGKTGDGVKAHKGSATQKPKRRKSRVGNSAVSTPAAS